MRQKRRRVWTSITAAAVLLPAGAADAASGIGDGAGPDLPVRYVQVADNGGEGGEAGGGGEGGEAGIDAAAAATDPVIFLTGLDVIAAHFHAGIAAYRADDRTAGAEMFAHGFSEVYADLGPTLKALGIADFGAAMTETIDLATAGAPVAEIETAAASVFAALAAAETKAPAPTKGSAAAAEKAATADMMNRAALQLAAAMKTEEHEPYLDGFGFFMAAKARAASLTISDPAIGAAFDALAKSYPSIERTPATPDDIGKLLAAVSRAVLVLTND